jgi:hypothetical protein
MPPGLAGHSCAPQHQAELGSGSRPSRTGGWRSYLTGVASRRSRIRAALPRSERR